MATLYVAARLCETLEVETVNTFPHVDKDVPLSQLGDDVVGALLVFDSVANLHAMYPDAQYIVIKDDRPGKHGDKYTADQYDNNGERHDD